MRPTVVVAFLVSLIFTSSLQAQSQAVDVAAVRAQIDLLKADYEKRIKALEDQLAEIQTKMLQLPETDVAAAPAAPPTSQTSAGALNPAISVVGNFVGRIDNQKVFNEEGERIEDRMNLRETEVDFRVPVDPYADGVVILSLESEKPGDFHADIEEGYVNIKKLPFTSTPLGMKFQVGRFRPPLGKFNTLHTHDLPTTMRSLPTEEFLGQEGYISQGVSTDFFVPTPWDDNSSLNGRFQVLTGEPVQAERTLEGYRDVSFGPSGHRPSYVGTLRWFKSAGVHNIDAAWSTYLHQYGAGTQNFQLHIADFFYRWKPFRQGEWKSYLLGGEFMFTKPAATSGRRPYGSTVFTQWQFDRRKYAGVRFDYTKAVFDPTLQRKSLTPYFSYYFSEFLRLRLNYEHRWSNIVAENRRNSWYVELNFIFGAHPPEPFWVNR